MDDKQLARWQGQLGQTKAELAEIGAMRPGSLSRQYRKPAARSGAYWQLSYTHRMRSHTRHVRAEEVERIKPMLANFKRFRELVERCVDLSIKIADREQERMRRAGAQAGEPPHGNRSGHG